MLLFFSYLTGTHSFETMILFSICWFIFFLLYVFTSDRFKVVVYAVLDLNLKAARYGMCRRVRVHERIHTFVVLLLGSCPALLSLPLGNAVCCFVFVFLHFI